MTEPTDETYFRWLCAKVLQVQAPTPSTTYWSLFRHMYSTEYIWLLSGDDNRAADGVELRLYFARETDMENLQLLSGPGCSVLEMLVAFSYRAEFLSSMTYDWWFWTFLDNLGLSRFNDAEYDEIEVSDILTTFVWRTYYHDGRGGLCPLLEPKRDQQSTELWYQLAEYLAENNL